MVSFTTISLALIANDILQFDRLLFHYMPFNFTLLVRSFIHHFVISWSHYSLLNHYLVAETLASLLIDDDEDLIDAKKPFVLVSAISSGAFSWLTSAQIAQAGGEVNEVYEVGELFELGIQLSYLLLLLGLLGVGSFFVIRQVLVRRELDLSAKELQVSLISLS